MNENKTITAIQGIRVGHYTDAENVKGCTVIRFPTEGATAAVDVRGSAPGTRETDLLDPINLVDKVHALVLSGGSAYGLDAASGVMRCLEKEHIGFPVGHGVVVPIVPAAVLFDLDIGNPQVRPSAEWGFQACQNAKDSPVKMGNIGAGTGATVGKYLGRDKAMKSGLGSAVIQLPSGVIVGAIVAVNALGDILDPDTGKILAGIRGEKPGNYYSSVKAILDQNVENIFPGTNTTIGVVATNVPLSKGQLKKIAQMAHDGMARAITPAHTMYDGDTIFAVSVPNQHAQSGNVTADTINLVGTAAAEATTKAIVNAVQQAKSVAGYPSASDWNE
ncbi:P1 family peptidase [Desulfovibrio inopinatus]|uniref:P1 family peptidase n=1 Tax=Desulfovibrio inopinatus TaxID=102109 RepID=UPI000480004C|nr:P1 family peptidase [Desulfovibrio inopinatus]